MFNIGFSELVVILLAALIFIKPEKFPAFIKAAGTLYSRLKHYLTGFTMDLKEYGGKQEQQEKEDNPGQ